MVKTGVPQGAILGPLLLTQALLEVDVLNGRKASASDVLCHIQQTL